jgi:hypothetical protein
MIKVVHLKLSVTEIVFMLEASIAQREIWILCSVTG